MSNDSIAKMIPFFRQYNIRKAALFGSVARQQQREDSDIDLLVSFRGTYDLLDMIGLKQDLEDALHTPIDLVTYESLKEDAFAQAALADGRVIYEQN